MVLAFIMAVIVYRTVSTITFSQSIELSKGIMGVDAALIASISSSVVLLIITQLMEMVLLLLTHMGPASTFQLLECFTDQTFNRVCRCTRRSRSK